LEDVRVGLEGRDEGLYILNQLIRQFVLCHASFLQRHGSPDKSLLLA
jgi:hypothetical protein